VTGRQVWPSHSHRPSCDRIGSGGC